MMTVHMGFDDTDSPRMGCTTYVAALLVEKLNGLGVSFLDYPNLIRLNPNVPWKTRGNGALCLRVRCREDLLKKIMETVISTVEEHADMDYAGTDPGVVFLFGSVPPEVKAFAKRTIQGLVEMEEALSLIRKFKGEAVGFKEGRGIIGGLAAIGEDLEENHTFELLAYRTPENCGTPRRVQASSVVEMSEKTGLLTFNSIDPETGRVLVTPRGPDPVLYGVRGESAEIVKQAHELIRAEEEVERWVIFRTNQGTDAHLKKAGSINGIQPFNPVIVEGTVVRPPWVIPGGHVIFSIKDETGQVDCAAYEPTGPLRGIVKKLIVGDLVEAHGGVRPFSSKHPLTLNLEKLKVLKLASKILLFNPLCPQCGRRMESMGSEKGFRCKKCGFHASWIKKVAVESKRLLEEGLYVTPPRSQRHLTKPLCRYGRERSGPSGIMIDGWHFP